MGSWGYGPFDSDSASDMLIGFQKPIAKVVSAKTDRTARYFYNEARAAIQLSLVAHGFDILGGPALDPAVEALTRMLNDEEWIDSWRNSAAVKKALRTELRIVKRKMAKCKGCSPRRKRK